MGGCGIETQTFPDPRAVLSLKLQAADGSPAIEVEAAVVQSVVERHGVVGLEFLRIQDADLKRLSQVIEAHLTKDKAGDSMRFVT